MENKKRKVVLITVIILILAIIGSIGGYAIYKQNKIKERSAEVKSDIANNLEIFDKGDRNKKLEIFKKLSTNKNAYQKEEYHQKGVLDDFENTLEKMKSFFSSDYDKTLSENTLEKMKSFFSSDYDKTLSENTLTDLDKLTDKSKIATAKENLESLLNTIESENVTLKFEKLEEKTTIAQDLIEKYTNRIKALEEEAKKKAEEEAKKKAESAAENSSYNSGNSGNGNYSSSDSSSDNSGSSGSNESSNSSGDIYVIRTERFEVNGNYGTRYFYSDGSVKIVMDSGEVENVEDPNGDIYG